jgi:DNA-binding SARP family transcriptional activator
LVNFLPDAASARSGVTLKRLLTDTAGLPDFPDGAWIEGADMRELQVFLFGTVRIVLARQPSPIKLTHTIQGLLAYLLLHRQRSHPREVLAGLFWGERSEERAHSCLSTALWRLRGTLELDGIARSTYLITGPTGEVSFGLESSYWLDVAAFEARIVQFLAQPTNGLTVDDAAALQDALSLYTADLLEGFFDPWAIRERERLRDLYINGMAHLMRYHRQQRAFEESLDCCQRILQHDPLREEFHREMMRLYLENGQRALAARQYESCRELLASELGIPPMPETQALYTQIVPQPTLRPSLSAPHKEATSHHQALRQLRLALRACEKAREQLQQAMRLAERLAEDSEPDSASI